ncbi:MAG: hypothetical protein ACR2M4_09925 [Actinomycetota bacterium]
MPTKTQFESFEAIRAARMKVFKVSVALKGECLKASSEAKGGV